MSTLILTQDILDAYDGYLRENEKSPYTIEKYLRDANAFRSFASGCPLTKELTVGYKRYLIESGEYADSSINSMLASLRGLFKFLGREDCNVTRIRTQEMPFCPESKSLAMGDYRRLLQAARGNGRLQMILKVLFGTGIRISELKYFTAEALRESDRQTSVRVSCKKKSRRIIIPEGLKKELLDYTRENGITEGVVFRTKSGKPVDRSNFWRQMKRLCAEAGVDERKVFPHNIRKLFARTFYEKSHDIAQLACLLGHSSINTTMIYVRRTEREVRNRVEQMVQEILYKAGAGAECSPGAPGTGTCRTGRKGVRTRHPELSSRKMRRTGGHGARICHSKGCGAEIRHPEVSDREMHRAGGHDAKICHSEVPGRETRRTGGHDAETNAAFRTSALGISAHSARKSPRGTVGSKQ